MWKPFQHDSELYLIKITHNAADLEVYLNDLQDVWYQKLSETEALQQFQRHNPMIDIKLESAVKEVLSLVDNITVSTIEMDKSDDDLKLNLKSKLPEFEVKYQFDLTRESPDRFLHQMTVPLIKTVKYLEEQQKMLCNLVQKKDRELEEYRLEKGEISRGDLKTEKFDEEVLVQNDEKSMLNVFGRSEFWDNFVVKHGTITANLLSVEKEPWNNVKRKRYVYNSKTRTKKGTGIVYGNTSKD